MGKLEEVLGKTDIQKEKRVEIPVPVYEGLRKIEDVVYQSGTSIKYWM